MKITVLDGHTLNPGDNPWDDLARLGELTVHDRTAPEDIIPRALDADIILTNKTPLDAGVIARLPRLKFVSVLATGYNVVDAAAARARGIPVANVPTYGTMSVAQHALALLLELADNAGAAHASVRAGRWSACQDFCYWDKSTVELDGLALGIVGFGRIGQQMARLGAALGMRILYNDRVEINLPGIVARRVPVEQLFAGADAVSLHCNQTAENLRFVNAALLGKMKPGAFLVNTARGTLINEADLAAALHAGQIAGAGLDVLETEPPPASHPLLAAPNCIITPHVAWSSLAGRKRLMQTTVANVRGFLSGAPVNVVNK
jgi:glycerate dehydrogenase